MKRFIEQREIILNIPHFSFNAHYAVTVATEDMARKQKLKINELTKHSMARVLSE